MAYYAVANTPYAKTGSGLSQTTVNSTVTNYQYTGLGWRNTKLGAQTVHYDYLPDGKTLSQMQLNANNSYQQGFDYIWLDDIPIAEIKTTYTTNNTANTRRLTYIHADHLNTPRLMTDANKTVVWKWHADAYGLVAPNENPDGDSISDRLDLRFPGQVADSETGLYYNLNRYYDPFTGRYTQSDPIGLDGGLNAYGYVGGNPISRTDPLGLHFCPAGTRPIYAYRADNVYRCESDGSDPNAKKCNTAECAADILPNPPITKCQKKCFAVSTATCTLPVDLSKLKF